MKKLVVFVWDVNKIVSYFVTFDSIPKYCNNFLLLLCEESNSTEEHIENTRVDELSLFPTNNKTRNLMNFRQIQLQIVATFLYTKFGLKLMALNV